MAQQPAPDSGLRVPIAAAVWTAPTTIYKYDQSAGFGTFSATKDAAIYAPEKGLLLLLKDGSWVLKKDVIKDGKALGTREWVGVSTITPADGIKNNMVVEAGQLLGIAKEDFALALNQSIDNVTQALDPARFLLMSQARFVVQEQRAPIPKTQAGPQPHAPNSTQPHADAPRGELATTQPSEIQAKERTFKPGHLVAAGVGGLFLGGLVAYNMRRR